VTIAVNKIPQPTLTAPKAAAGKAKASGLEGLLGGDLATAKAAAGKGDFAEVLMDAEDQIEPMLAVDMDGLTEGVSLEGLVANGAGMNPTAVDMSALETPVPVDGQPTPELMDPKLMKQVQDLVTPEGAEQVQVTPGLQGDSSLQDLLNTKAAAPSRSPAIDIATSEANEPQLMQFEDFVAQRNAFNKKGAQTGAYGMPNKLPVIETSTKAEGTGKAVLESELTPVVVGGTSAAIMALSPDALPAVDRVETAMSAPSKVFNMNSMQGKSLDADSVISQITDYVVQARAAKEPTVQLSMQHESLGRLDITVSRHAGDMVNIAINTQDQGAKLFLGQHRDQLMGHLNQAGVNVGELRMDNSSKNDTATGQQQQSFGQQGERQFGSESNQRREEQNRRQDLWAQFQQEVA
jgi:flagellar hook-length control protein FliK